MRRLIVGTLVAAGLFLVRMILLVLGLFLGRMDGTAAAPPPDATASTNGHARPASAT